MKKISYNKDIKIFQIGFNKCGTSSIHRFFRGNQIPANHWPGKAILEDFEKARKANKKPFTLDRAMGGGNISARECIGFTDMEWVTAHKSKGFIEAYKHFKYIYNHYKDSYFILNTRPVENWIKSRINQRFVDKYACLLKIEKSEVTEYWRKDWEDHHKNVKDFFKDKGNFIVFDIEKDNPEKLCNFLKKDFPNLKPSAYGQTNITKTEINYE